MQGHTASKWKSQVSNPLYHINMWSNPDLLHHGQILCYLGHQKSPVLICDLSPKETKGGDDITTLEIQNEEKDTPQEGKVGI